MKKFKCVSDHPEDLDGGRVLAPGEFVELDDEAVELPRMQQLLNEGRLLDVTEARSEPTPLGGRNRGGDS